MSVIAALIAFTLSVYSSNARDPQSPWQMPQYQAGGLSFSPVLKEFPQQQRVQFSPELSQMSSSFSGSQRCVLEQYERIECGEPGITSDECELISCCYDAQGCYYATAVTLQCTRDGQFVLVVARDATMPHISLDSIHMLENDPSDLCAPVGSTASFAIYQFTVSSCGTRMKEESGFVIYENMMSSAYEVGVGPRGSITRDSSYELKFQCRYSGSAVEALVVEVNTVPPPPPVSQNGPLRVELRLADGQCSTKGCSDEDMYTSYYSEADYPVTKVLREPVYVEVRILERTDPNLILVLDHCWTTSNPESLSLPQWDLVINGCPYKEDHHLTTVLPVAQSGLQYPSHYKRFVVKMFTFVDQSSLAPQQERIFVHCTTSVCHPSTTESCEPSCGSRTRRAISEDLKDSEEKVVVSSGEVIFVPHLPVSDNLADKEVPQILDYGLWAAGALTVFGVCGLVVAVLIQRAKPRPQPAPV
ncbi:zona pellucida sperm-binding protein 4-like [Sinocyclocheilus rhinocerous]|uniref:Zona pellucida sperm-binding protein 4 n=1 Tax=Sinocyclocheilus rhinocerous TaxID=307959 RepID=A0A673GX62_9TELE|nr:PREDICTED: zona pellucida sperm-binding protein 4-like [Sinocyclocheilus rhinocerous]XP_016365920.1 PREDICTED: zona pellucida sperm-binding protein 4-like [Sinocyclocheilus rhinocerous]